MKKPKPSVKGDDKKPTKKQIEAAIAILNKAGGFKIIRLIESEKDIIL